MDEKLLASIVSALIDAGLDGPDGVGHSEAKAALRAIKDAGYAVVPVEMSDEMAAACGSTFLSEMYRQILAAAPDVTGDEG